MRPRLEYRPDGSFPWQAAVGAPLAFVLGLLFLRGCFKGAGLPLGVQDSETTWVTIASLALALAAAWKPLRRVVRWLVRAGSLEQVALGHVADSVAERQWQRRHPDDVRPRELEPLARYLLVFEPDDGEPRICDVPKGLWATLQPGDRVQMVWRGWDILELSEISREGSMDPGEVP